MMVNGVDTLAFCKLFFFGIKIKDHGKLENINVILEKKKKNYCY